MLALCIASALVITSPALTQARGQGVNARAGSWAVAPDAPGLPEATSPEAVLPSSNEEAAPDEEREAQGNWLVTFELWQRGISYLSALGPLSPVHGRNDVVTNADQIELWAPDDLELLVAAAIAHQASDFKDRPFGIDAIEVIWRGLFDDGISVGIAQLRSEEVADLAPELAAFDPLSPEIAIRVMASKVSRANRYILQTHPEVSDTDRFMLLALAQNAASYATMLDMVDYFFDVAGADWSLMLAGEPEREHNWRLQLRLVLLHADWLVEQGWPPPEGLDLVRWTRIAFSGS